MALNLNKIKGLFIVPEDEAEGTNIKTEEKKVEVKKTEPVLFANKEQTSTIQTVSSKGEFNQNIFNSLTKAISDANLPGEDYLEFVDALQAMKDIPLDETIKMQTVLATLSTRGLTTQKIIETADYYLKVLEREKDKFKEATAQQTHGKVDNKQTQIKQLEESNQKKAEQIKILTEEINQNNLQMVQIKKEIEESDIKIKATENNFNVTFDFLSNQILSKVEKIKNLSSNLGK
jgi:hydroxypyruvate isomerase